jgi:rhodanese-related sulfurtransferase
MSFKQLGASFDRLGISPDEEVAVTCAGGLRSIIACSILQRHGFSRVLNVEGGMNGWRRAGLPVE